MRHTARFVRDHRVVEIEIQESESPEDIDNTLMSGWGRGGEEGGAR